MAKDPAFLFYPSDFLTGTMFFTNEEIGIYIKLLCIQHQQNGSINKNAFESIVSKDSIIRDKFKIDKEGYYNQRLLEEMVKRQKKSDNLSANALKRWKKEKQKQCKSNAIASAGDMPTEDENRNENEDVIEYENIKNTWNFFAKQYELSQIQKITSTRKAHIKARIKESDFELVTVLREAEKQPFLLGKNKKGWSIDFDWIFGSPNNYIKVLENKYKGKADEGATISELTAITQKHFGGNG